MNSLTLLFPERTRPRWERLSPLIQALVWSIYIVLPFLLLALPQFITLTDALSVFGIKTINDLLSISFFYLNLYILTPDVLQRRRLTRFILFFVGLIALMFLVDSVYYKLYLDEVLGEIAQRNSFAKALLAQTQAWIIVPTPMLLPSLLSLLLVTSVSSGLAIYRDREQYVTAGQQMIIEKQEAELTALKLQISPHFLFNTLNNLRWLARQKSDAAEDALLRLSELMRYMIYQVDKGPVTLAKEIRHLEHYVELQRLRLTPNHRLTFEVRADDLAVRIEPLLFIHFVENAFKYGLHSEEPAPIVIRLTFHDGLLRFQTQNRLFPPGTPSVGSGMDSGLGIPNIRRRLALHYPDQHQLRIDRQADLFTVNLTIQLLPQGEMTQQV